MKQTLHFYKLQGLGNDFILINNLEGAVRLGPKQVQKLCDRRFGIGADGIMMVEPPLNPENDFSWFFANSDGTFPEMCGNGIRAFAVFVKNQGLVSADTKRICIETLAGVKVAEYWDEGNIRVDMGQALSVSDGQLTTLLSGQDGVVDAEIEVEHPLLKTEVKLKVSAVSMGNPHAVLFVDELGFKLDDETVNSWGPLLEAHPAFPHKTNVEFVKVKNPTELEMRVYERGVGETLACGTGACAAAFAAYLKGLVEPKLTVKLLGGNLQIEIGAENRIFMIGPAEQVYLGEISIKYN